MLLAEGGQLVGTRFRQVSRQGPVKGCGVARRGMPLLPLPAGNSAAFGHRLPGGFDAGGNGERVIGPVEFASRALAISSLPSGAPWVLCDPCIVGAPLPIVVRQAISEGLELLRAFSMAAATASGSWPSTF
jgi:hypothetical protein